MKKCGKTVFLLVLAIVLCFSSCDKVQALAGSNDSAPAKVTESKKNSGNDGKLSISVVPFDFDSFIVPVDSSVSTYKVHGTNGSENFDKTFDGDYVVLDVKEGEWTVSLEGFNSEDEKMVEAGKKTATVKSGETSYVTFEPATLVGNKGNLVVRLDVPESAKIKTIHVSVRNQNASEDKAIVKEFNLDKQFNWRRFDKFIGHTEGLECGNYIVVADFTDSSNTYLFSKELGEAVICSGETSVFSDEEIIAAPVFAIANNSDGSKSVSFDKDFFGTAIFYTNKSEKDLPDEQLHLKGTRFVEPIKIVEDTKLRAVAVADDKVVSPVSTSGEIKFLKAKAPVADLKDGTYPTAQNVQLSTVTPDCDIYYTTDGTNPTRNSQKYSLPVKVAEGTTIKAIAASRNGSYKDSDVAEFNYRIKALPPVTLLKEGTYSDSQQVKLDNQTKGCTIYYTVDGSEPTVKSAVFSNAIPVSKNTVIKAVASGNGYETSDVATFDYKIKTPAVLTATPDWNVIYYNDVDVTLDAKGADIYYTLDGKTPTLSSTKYKSPIKLTKCTDVKAIAVAKGFVESDPQTFDYKLKVANPTANVEDSKVYSMDHDVILKTKTKGATIRYSVDGGAEKTYSSPLKLSSGRHEIVTYGIKDGWIDSDKVTLIYDTIRALDTPVISEPTGQYKKPLDVKLSTVGRAKELNADILYTMDNSMKDSDIETKGIKYVEGQSIRVDKNATIRAVAAKKDYITSAVASEKYTMYVKDVSFSSIPVEGKTNVYRIEIECDTEGAKIYYTIDGKTPTTSSAVYTVPFEVTKGVEVQAFAVKNGCEPSGVISYTRKK